MVADKPKGNSILDWIERIGNKIPHPFILFLVLAIVVIVISAICTATGVSVINPVTGKAVAAKNLISADGVNFMLQSMVRNFTGFAPLGLVLVMTLGIGLAENVGMISTLMRQTILNAPPKLLTMAVMLIAICGNIASDAAIIIIPMIAAFIFMSVGKHPILGIAVGYAGAAGGFSANLLVAGTDALLAGISTEAVRIVAPGREVSVVANWYFMVVSTILLTFVGAFVAEKFVEPRLGKYTGSKEIKHEAVTPEEKRALKISILCTGLYILTLVAILFPSTSFLRSQPSGSLMDSPFLKGIIPLLFIMFVVAGISYGVVIGKIKSSADVPKIMTDSMKGMASYIVLVFMIGQFIAYFNWSNLGYILAVKGAIVLTGMKLTGIPLFVLYVLFVSFINLFMGSGSAKWALLAPIFVPMFYMMGYSPELTQVLYRIGDSTTNIISPLFPYTPIILGLFQEYDPKSGVGSVISTMLPFTIGMLIMWLALAIVWVLFNVPLGPGVLLYVTQ